MKVGDIVISTSSVLRKQIESKVNMMDLGVVVEWDDNSSGAWKEPCGSVFWFYQLYAPKVEKINSFEVESEIELFPR